MNQTERKLHIAQRYPYTLRDSNKTGLIGVYKALTIALRDCAKLNAEVGERRFYVERPNGSRVTA